jgi:4-amino-4-deoxy-L-arabinose transferase-like glycosyltransferase
MIESAGEIDVDRGRPTRGPIAWPWVGAVAGAVTLLLIAVANRYGYHRDELYFIRAGSEPAFGYADQPPLTPVLAHALQTLFDGSLVGLRLPSAVMAGMVVLLTGLLAREFGANRGAQVLAAACIGVSAVLLVVSHMLSTTTVDLLVWTAISWLVVRALRDGGPVWLAVGAVAGVGLQNKMLPAFLLAALLVGVAVAGPRTALRSPWPWVGGLLVLLLWVPNLAWQATNGFPQLELSAAIAAGSSGTSEPWYVFLPFQLILVSPLLIPVWVVGWWRLARDPRLRTWRAFAVAYVVLAVVFIATGGKPYYLAGLYPVLLAAGAAPVLGWARSQTWRSVVLGAALVLSAATSSVLMLPLVPVERLAETPIVDVNYDAGETVGWPQFAATVAAARATVPATDRVAVLTRNYGEAGAVDRYLPELAPAYSGHNAYWEWGPPPEDVTSVIAVGFSQEELRSWFGQVELAGRIDNGVGLENDEQGTPVWVASGQLVSWDQIWPQLRSLG